MLSLLTAAVLASSLFDVEVLARSGTTVKLKVESVHPDSGPPTADLGFALSLLSDEAQAPAPLAAEVDLDDVLDDAWLAKNARGFVKQASVKPLKGKAAELTLEVTHAAWLAHLKVGQHWDTASFDHRLKYEACPPVAPGKRKEKPADPSAGFMTVPLELLEMNDEAPRGPALLRVPAYGVSSYTTEPASDVSALVGEPVEVGSDGRRERGAVLWVDGFELGLMRVSEGSSGFGRYPVYGIKRLVYAPHAAERARLSFEGVIRRVPTVVDSATVKGDRVTLKLRVPPDGRAAPAFGETDALALLAVPVIDAFGETRFDCPLARALAAEQKKRKVPSPIHIYPDVARDFVKSAKVQFGPPPSELPGAVPPAREREFLSRPWPSGVVEIQVTDPRWAEHLAKVWPRTLR